MVKVQVMVRVGFRVWIKVKSTIQVRVRFYESINVSNKK